MKEGVRCCVPGCGRGMGEAAWTKRFGSIPNEHDEYVCQTHWQAVPSAMRRAYARVRRRERRFGFHLSASSRLWSRLKREAGALPPLRRTSNVDSHRHERATSPDAAETA